MTAEVIGDIGRGRFGLEFHHSGEFDAQLAAIGEPPVTALRAASSRCCGLDWQRYQTIYATHPGAIAAPTAGFHFTPELLEKLTGEGVH